VTADSPSPQTQPGKLPSSGLPFVGRQAELSVLLRLFEDTITRLVTILGVGGTGKTRLALELAGRLQPRFRQGVFFISLAQLRTVEELLPALAGALGVQLPPSSDLQQAVLDYLCDKQILLILDNFEHLLDEALLVRDLLEAGPQVKVLVTSREKLNLQSETLYHLHGLDLPPIHASQPVEDFDAVRLFLQKARQARPSFSLTAENTPAVIRICRLVGGIPLGILMAAAWAEHFSPAEIADQISHNLDFLAHDLRDGLPRHASMRAVFASSFNRLDEHHQAVFRKLAVFRGGFSLTAAKAIAAADLRALLALVDKSLLWRDPDSGRYDLHELLRQYAGEALAAAGERAHSLAAHAAYYSALVCQRQTTLKSPSQVQALDEIDADFDNIRQAWAGLIEQRDFAAVRNMTPGLYAFCDMRSRFYEGEALFRLASEGLSPQGDETPHPAWALVLLSWYDLRVYIERFETFDTVITQAQACLEQAVGRGDVEGIAASLVLLGAIAEDQGEFKTAIRNYERGMQSYPSLDDMYWVNMRIGLCHQAIREYTLAIQAFRVSLQRGQATGERVKLGWSLLNIGDTLLLQRNAAEAEDYLVQAWQLFQAVGTTAGVLWANYSLSQIALQLGDAARSRELAETARQIAQQIHSAAWMKKVDDLLGRLDPQSPPASAATARTEPMPFSEREIEVLQLLKSDLSGPEIARRLVISLNTVRYHTKNIYQKLQATNRLEAIHRAEELGL
jgi:predicted ATPase/DNA-binding CsgD family transcriptional regulator